MTIMAHCLYNIIIPIHSKIEIHLSMDIILLTIRCFHSFISMKIKEFFDEYNEINIIYMEGKNLKYTIFAAFQFTDVHIMYQYKFENNEQMQDFFVRGKGYRNANDLG